MKLSAFQTRILASAVATSVLALVMVLLTVRTVLGTTEAVRPTVVPASLIAACRADPVAWSNVEIGLGRLRFFDGDGRSADPEVPPLDPGVVLAVGDSRRFGQRPISDLHHLEAEGPCAWAEIASFPPAEIDEVLPTAFAVGTALAVLVVGLATWWWTVVPLVRRIERLGAAARGVGGDRYTSAADVVGDALADISRVLDDSHARLEADRAELVRRHEALERYMAELAHDLRTPLHSLWLALQEVSAATGATPAARRALDDAHYVSTLVENLHHAARLRHGLDPLLGETDLRDLVGRLEVRFRALGAGRGVLVAASAPDRPVVVRCNPALAERAVANLVQNAVAHARANAALVLEARDGAFELSVLDDGEGLPDDQLADLALRTFVADPARRRGPGLGLAITHEVARRAGWTIVFAAGDEGGLRVVLRGPIAATEPANG